MRQTLLISPHSFVDVITNSSTALFVCDTDKSINAIMEILEKMLVLYNDLSGDRRSFDDVFNAPFLATEENYDSDNDDDTNYASWAEYYPNLLKGKVLGKVILMGASDNSIPYTLFDMIETTLNANRCHLG